MSVDNPYYFNNVGECSKSPESPGKATFSFFRKRSSSSKLNAGSPSKAKVFPSPTASDTVSLGGSRRGSLRSLIRSKSSTTSSVSYSQGVIMGECRPNPTHFRHRLGSYNESISYGGSDDVFLSDHRHNNFQNIDFHIPRVGDVTDGSSSSGLRRHSIGTFTHKERTRCGSFSDEVPKMPAPKPPTSSQSPSCSSTMRKGSKCITSGRNMDDILIVTSRQSEPAILWANYLKTRFDKITKQRGRIAFNFLHVKIEDGNLSADIVSRCLSTKLQIVIICPSLLALPHSQLMTQLSAILRPEKVLGLLLEIDELRVLDIHRQALPNFKQWRRCVVRSKDQSFVGNVLGIATDILGPALRDQPLSNSVTSSLAPQSTHDAFTVLPRKLRMSQNKVVALLTEPLKLEDNVVVKIEKTGEMLEVPGVKRRNPYTLQFSVPESCMEVSMMIEIHIEKNGNELGSRPIKCESRLREMEQILKAQDSPLEFICQSLGISSVDRERLDGSLLQAFQKNIPPNFHLLAGDHKGGFLANRESSPEEYPTLLHFAAKWGLEKLSMQLLDCPGGDVATSVRNVNGKTPLDLAELEGHVKLIDILKNFTQMHEFTTMYHYFKGISDSTSNKVIVDLKSEIKASRPPSTTPKKAEETSTKVPEYMEMTGSSSSSDHGSYGPVNAVTNLNYINVETKSNCGEDVCDGFSGIRISEDEVMTNELRINEPAYYESKDCNKTDDFSQECSNLLEEAVSDGPLSDYLVQPSNRPVTLQQQDFPNYLTHPSNRPVEPSYVNDTIISPIAKMSPSTHDSHMRFTFKRRDDGSRSGTLKRQGSDTSKVSVDDELLEIINDFKNNVFTITEVEQLVSTWQNRNDVQQSFKDKQQQLQEMRDEYERIQSRMEKDMKRPTPFERFKRLFTRSKSHEKCEREVSGGSNSQRPISSLSLQSVSSSSSSGRMSTGSVCSGTSLGDSGTHSDHEDRRQMYNCRVGVPGSLMENYSVPPAPRVVSQPPTDHHYVLFPSNVPVYGSSAAVSPTINHDYLNFNGLNTIEEAKETDFPVTVQPIKIQRSDTLYSKNKRDSGDLCTSFKATTPPVINDETSPDSDKNAKDTSISNSDVAFSELDLQTQETIRNFNRTIKECNEDLHHEQTAKVPENHPNHDYINLQLNTEP